MSLWCLLSSSSCMMSETLQSGHQLVSLPTDRWVYQHLQMDTLTPALLKFIQRQNQLLSPCDCNWELAILLSPWLFDWLVTCCLNLVPRGSVVVSGTASVVSGELLWFINSLDWKVARVALIWFHYCKSTASRKWNR